MLKKVLNTLLPFLSAKIRDGIKLSHLVGKRNFWGRGENEKTFATNSKRNEKDSYYQVPLVFLLLPDCFHIPSKHQ